MSPGGRATASGDVAAGLRLLVVDDDPDQRYLVRRLFLRAGAAEVLEAGDGREALDVAAARELDLVLLDLTMPVMSGMEALPHLRDVLSGHDDDLLERVVLLTSELVTNAVVHARSDARVRLRLGPGMLRVEVGDDDPGLPVAREPDAAGPGGRGLRILDEVASRWGVDPDGPGKVVWFELPRPVS